MTRHCQAFSRTRSKQIAAATKRKPADIEAECLEFGFFIGVDWAGRPAIGEQDARGLVSGEARQVREHDARWQSHLDECADWTRRRDLVVQAAGREALDKVRQRGRGGPEADAVGREAAIEAGRQFERTTPVPTFDGQVTGNAVPGFTSEDERPSLRERVTRRVRRTEPAREVA